jgi:hypothetical protein
MTLAFSTGQRTCAESRHSLEARVMKQIKQWLRFLSILFIYQYTFAAPLRVLHSEGEVHGFLLLRTPQGKTIAAGDLTQTIHNKELTNHLEFHFTDGSVHEEIAVYTQQGNFHLLSYRLVEKGPSFAHPVEMQVDATTGQVTVRELKDGKNKVTTNHLSLPDNLANGLIPIIVKNVPSNAAELSVSMVAATPKPRLVTFTLSPRGTDSYSVGGAEHQAKHYVGKVKIGGVAGVVAPIVGKQPPDTDLWISSGDAPTFLKSKGPVSADSPVWEIQLTSPEWPQTADLQKSGVH